MSYVYAIQAGSDGPIKIGRSLDVKKRRYALQISSPIPLSILCSFEESRCSERALHRQLAEYRLSGEWFQNHPRVLDALAAAKAKPLGEHREIYSLRVAACGLTPAAIRERATKARLTINKLMEAAGLPNSTFWRWERGDTSQPHPVTIQKISDALTDAEKAKAA